MVAALPWLHLQPPVGWVASRDATRRSARPPGGGLGVEWFPLGPLPRRQLDWVRRVLGRGLDAGATLGAIELTTGETAKGWPFVCAEAEVVGGAWARRLGGFYAFFEHGGHALVHAGDRAAWAAEDAVRRMLAAGEPDLRDLVVALQQVYAP